MAAEAPRKVTISVASIATVKALTAAAFRGEVQGRFVSFATTELLWKTLSPKRLALLQAVAGRPPMSIREAARRVARDVKAVHGDVQILLGKRLLAKTEDGRIECPYDEIHLDVVLRPLEADAA